MHHFPFIALIKRELLTNLRKRRTFALLGMMVAVQVVIVGVAAYAQADMRANGDQGKPLGPFFMFLYGGLSMLVANLVLPAMAAVSINGEREQNTFDLLFTTLVRPLGIVAAKLFNLLGLYVLFLVAGMPVLGIVFFFIGVDWVQFVQVFALLLSMATLCVLLGLAASANSAHPIRAIVLSYVCVFFLVGVPSPLWTTMMFSGGMRDFAIRPSEALAHAMWGGFDWETFAASMLYQFLIAAIAFELAWYGLQRTANPAQVDGRKPIDDPRKLRERQRRFPFYLVDPLRRRKPIADRRNPIAVKDQNTGMAGRGTVRIRVFYLYFIFCAILSIMAIAVGMGGREDLTGLVPAWIIYEAMVVLALAPAFMATSMAREHELGNMDMLRMTLEPPWRIVLGKFNAALLSLAPLILASFVSLIPVGLFATGMWTIAHFAPTGYLLVIASLMFTLSVVQATTVLARKSAVALVIAYLGALVLLAVVPFALFYWRESRSLSLAIDPSQQISSFPDTLLSISMECWPSPLRAALLLPDEKGPFWDSFWGPHLYAAYLFLWTALLLGLSTFLYRRYRAIDR